MKEAPAVTELVLRWQELRDQGKAASAEELCAGHPELLDDLRRRLQALASMEKFLGANSAAATVAGETLARRTAEAGEPLAAVPGYEVLGELGRGGMGVVYKARQERLDRTVALKVILAGARAGADDLARFRTEAKAAARLQHPNIVQVHEVGEHRGLPYLSLEFCAGGSLETKLGGTPLPSREAATLVEALARALQAAHDKGIIHRDLKPANVLLAEDGTPKVTDFGLARRLEDVGRTQTGAVMGTPSYMAPEQARGQGKEVGPATDVYALGAVLYECLTGRPPFRGATLLDTLEQVRYSEPVPPRQLNAKVPGDLETVCLRCLDKDPARRYGSARDLADDLARFRRGEPVRARPVGRLGRGWRWCRRNRTVAALLAAVAVALVAGAGAATVFAVVAERRASEAKEEAEKARRLADDQRRLLDSFKTLLLALRESEPLYFLGGYGTSGTATAEANPLVKSLTARFPELLRDPPADPVLRADLFHTVGDFYRNYGEFDQAEPLLKEALALRREHLGEEHPDYAASLHSLAWLYHDQGDYAAAEELYRQALVRRERSDDAVGLDATRFNLARLLLEMGDYGPAEELLRAVIQARTARDGDASRPVAVAKFALAALYLDRGEPEKALKWHREAFTTFVGIDGDKGLWRAVSLCQQAMMAAELPPWLRRGNPEALFQESLSLTGSSLGEHHIFSALVLHELAHYRESQKDDKGAEECYRQCLDVAEASKIGYGHPRVAIAVSSLARLLGRTGRAEEADLLFEKLLEAHRKRFGRDHFLVADALTEQSFVLRDRPDRAGEARALAAAVAMYSKADRLRGRCCVRCLNNQAVLYSREQKYANAQELLEKALALARRNYGQRQEILGRVLANLAFAKLRQGDTQGVEDHLREAERCLPALSFNPPLLLNDVLAEYGQLYRRIGRIPDAEAVALRRGKAYARDAGILYQTACDLAQLVPLVQESAAQERYADLAMKTLQQAVKAGWKDADQLGREPALNPLRSRAEFKQLLSQLGAR